MWYDSKLISYDVTSNSSYELIQNSDKKFIIGSDEVGCASLAGCLTICAVRASKEWSLEGLGDSKKLTRKQREVMEIKLLKEVAAGNISYIINDASNKEIDTDGFGNTFKRLHIQAISQLNQSSDNLIIIDGKNNLNLDLKGSVSMALIKADGIVPTVMAASILAKTHRDAIMRKLHDQFPFYGWLTNVGYGTKQHYAAMKEHGITEYHRTSFNTVLDYKK